MAVMAAHPLPVNTMGGYGGLEALPQVDILDRLAVGGLPAARIPAAQPFGGAVDHIAAIGIQRDGAGPLQCLERLDGGGQFQAVGGGGRDRKSTRLTSSH